LGNGKGEISKLLEGIVKLFSGNEIFVCQGIQKGD